MAVPKVKRSEIFWELRSATPTWSRPGHGYGAEYEIRKIHPRASPPRQPPVSCRS